MTMDAENYYEILGIRPDASDEAVKQAYRELAKNYHPDRNPGDRDAELRFKLIGTAYEALKDADRRQSYNEYLAFNRGQKEDQRRQWGRLVAVTALLLIGPVVVVYGVFLSGSLPWLKDGVSISLGERATQTEPSSGPAVTDASEPELARTEPEEPVEDAPAKDDRPETSDADNTVASVEESAAEIAQSSSEGQASAEPSALEQETSPINAETADDATEIAMDEAANGLPPVAQSEIAEQAAPPETQEETGPAYTNAIPHASGDAERDLAAADITQRETAPVMQPLPDTTVNTVQTVESSARASARLLSDLKEPEGAITQEAALTEDGDSEGDAAATAEADGLPPLPVRRVASRIPLPPRPTVRARPFADCRSCPLMSPRTSSAARDGHSDFAVSLSEISLSQWNVCVNDGFCSPYPRQMNDPEAPVTGLSKAEVQAYAEWLTVVTGESYRIVRALDLGNATTGAAQEGREACERGLTDFDWLEEGPSSSCSPASTDQTASETDLGFRVARRMGSDG